MSGIDIYDEAWRQLVATGFIDKPYILSLDINRDTPPTTYTFELECVSKSVHFTTAAYPKASDAIAAIVQQVNESIKSFL